jgi:hypothetical protein
LKAVADQLALILTELYQTSPNTGVVPQDWKDAHVVPLFKKDEKSRRMISTCESLSNFDAISWMDTMRWDSHDRFLDWEDAHVVPLFKKDERHLASNYRPYHLHP